MKTSPYFLVIISAFTHSIWNFLVKRSNNKDIFIGLSKTSEAVIFVIPFVWFLSLVDLDFGSWLLFVVSRHSLCLSTTFFISNLQAH